MAKSPNWTDQELTYLGFLIESGHTYNEIYGLMPNRTKESIRIKAQRFFGGCKVKSHTKHKHLRESVFKYFLNHTAKETMKKFKLNRSEFKSIFTVGYRDPKLKHLRKDKRNKDKWNSHHYKILLQNAGLKSRSEIAELIGKGNVNSCIKERLQRLGLRSKNVNGVTLSQYRNAFKKEPDFYIQTKAGPGRGNNSSTHWKIIPWVILKKEINNKEIEAPEIMKILIETMAMFQEWIFEGKTKGLMQ